MKLKTTFFVFCLAILQSCTSSKKTYDNTNFEVVYESSIGGNNAEGIEIITSNEDYLKLIERLKLDEVDDTKLLDADFDSNQLIVLYLGEKNTGGYSISIEKLYWIDTILHIKTLKKIPAKGEMVTMAITHPYCIAIIPKAETVIVD